MCSDTSRKFLKNEKWWTPPALEELSSGDGRMCKVWSYMVVSGNGDANKLQIYNYYGKQFEKSGDTKFKQAQESTEMCQNVLIINI